MLEAAFCEVLGVHRDRLRGIRSGLVEGTHWQKRGRAIVWLSEGQAEARRRVLEAVGGEMASEIPRVEAVLEPAGEKMRTVGRLKVVRRVLNPRIVMASPLGDLMGDGRGAAIVRVRVRSSANFVVGMVLQAQQVKGDLWELCGRCPRWRGRW